MIKNIHFHDFIMTLTSALDARDPYTCGHSLRVAEFSCALAIKLEADDFDRLHFAAHLHDIGKIGIRDRILLKRGRLTDKEFKAMKKHPVTGYEILSNSKPLKEIAIIVRHHHERYDGNGYPDGLAGEEIPFSSRIIAVADALDAMTSARPYRQPVSSAAAVAEIVLHSGDQFDPSVVELLEQNQERLDEIISAQQGEVILSATTLAHQQIRHSRGT